MSQFTSRELKNLLSFCEQTALDAGKKLVKYQKKIKDLKVESKDY